MKIVYDGNDPGLIQATSFVNRLWNDEDFWQAVLTHAPFDYSTISTADIVSRLRSSQVTYTVKMWKPSLLKRAFYANTVAMTDPDIPFVLFYHTKFIGNSTAEKASTIAHEFIHNIDNNDGDTGEQMGHGDNDWRGKQDSAPYWIGRQVAEQYRRANPDHMKSFAADSEPYCGQIDGHASDGDVVDD